MLLFHKAKAMDQLQTFKRVLFAIVSAWVKIIQPFFILSVVDILCFSARGCYEIKLAY
jgi:hypothetical protein